MGGECYISFSGGKDSTVLLHIARSIFPDIKAVYIDTGLEYPEIKEFVKTFDNVDIIRPKKSFLQVIEECGYPVVSKEVSQRVYEARRKPDGAQAERLGIIPVTNKYATGRTCYQWRHLYDAPFKISHKCCNVMKKAPAKEYEKITGTKPIVATMADESLLRKAEWLKSGCNSFDGNRPMSKPMSFWTEQDVLQYIKLHNLPVAKVYGDLIEEDGKLKFTGCPRTGCVFCAFGAHLEKSPNRFQRLKETHPKLWDYCINGKLNMKQVLDYIGVPYE